MVTLPSIDQHSKEHIEGLSLYSPIFRHYRNLSEKDSTLFSDQVRIRKHQHWLKCALATFADTANPETVCRYWSEQTELILQEVWNSLHFSDDEICLLLYGKLGSRELNLSSDIDIVFVKSNESDNPDLQGTLRKFIKLLSETTTFGFAYRTDLNLRPGGEFSPLVPTKNNFFNFYDEYLEAWHRLSFIRVRSFHPDSQLSKDLISYCKKRCFPKRLDFSVIEEIKGVRSKINFQWRKAQEPFDIKLHPGGIRDIELLLHSLQVIYGGRNSSLRQSQITPAIDSLQSMGALKKDEADFLLKFYWQLRKIENLIHIKEDKHTYLLQKSFFRELPQFNFNEKFLADCFEFSKNIIEDFFSEAKPKPIQSNFTQGLSESSKKAISEIKSLKSTSIKKQGVESLKDEILDEYVRTVQRIAIDEDLAIQIFRDFIFSIKSKTSIFFLLGRHKELLESLAWLFSISPFVGQILTRRPELVDSFALGQVVLDEHEDIETLWESLVDYKLLGQLMGIVDFFKKPKENEFFLNLSEQADLICTKLLNRLTKDYSSSPLEILTLGKWSGKELGVRSDLDFVFLSDSDPTPQQLKVARRMITLLTTQSNAGRLYDIDLRLKPNQSSGPLILNKSQFFDFIQNKAEAWQKQAYLRSRLCSSNEFFLKEKFNQLHINESDFKELNEIHKKLIKPNIGNSIDIKHCPGGLIETEFKIQKIVLSNFKSPTIPSTSEMLETIPIDSETKTLILKNYFFLRRLEQTMQITTDSSSTKVGAGNNNLGRVAKLLSVEKIYEELLRVTQEQQELLKRLDLTH